MGKNQVLRTVKDIDVQGKRVLLRMDLDVPLTKFKIVDDTRLINTLPTIRYLLDKQAKVTMIGHLGRPLKNSKLSLNPVRRWYEERLVGYKNWELWENLRFDPGEEANLQSFAKDIVRRSSADLYIFEAFATAHEPHASVISVPKLVRETVVGFRFAEEIRNLSKIWQNPKRPMMLVLGGSKIDTKISLIPKLAEQADEVLIGGLLPTKLGSVCLPGGGCITAAKLTGEGLDITEESARMFADKIMTAGTVVWNGPVGAYERADKEEGRRKKEEGGYKNTPAWGTYIVAKAMRETGAFTVAGGGDTEAGLTKLGGSEGIDWISSGGGAMLYYLAYHTLPFLEAIKG